MVPNIVNRGGKKSENKQPIDKSEETEDLAKITEFGDWPGALFLLFSLPFLLLYVAAFCDVSQCSFTKLPNLKKFTTISTYLHYESTLGIVGFAISLFLLEWAPFRGKKVHGLPTKEGTFLYTMNGISTFIILFVIAVLLELSGVNVSNFIVVHRFHLTVASFLVGVVFSIFVYIRSFFMPSSALNITALNKKGIYGFVLGRELNPRLFGTVDLKMYTFHYSVIGPTVYILAAFYDRIGRHFDFNLDFIHIQPTLLVLCICQFIYLIDALISEAAWLTTFEIQYEGFGYLGAAGYLVYPILFTTTTAYVYEHHVDLPLWRLALSSLAFLVGMILFRASNSQKDAFRRNPQDPALAHLETIPTKTGKKIICSGLWGFVRHPNYLGDMLINSSYCLFAISVPAVLPTVSFLIHLTNRTVRDNVRCKLKYGAAWDRYCEKVKYILVPYVY